MWFSVFVFGLFLAILTVGVWLAVAMATQDSSPKEIPVEREQWRSPVADPTLPEQSTVQELRGVGNMSGNGEVGVVGVPEHRLVLWGNDRRLEQPQEPGFGRCVALNFDGSRVLVASDTHVSCWSSVQKPDWLVPVAEASYIALSPCGMLAGVVANDRWMVRTGEEWRKGPTDQSVDSLLLPTNDRVIVHQEGRLLVYQVKRATLMLVQTIQLEGFTGPVVGYGNWIATRVDAPAVVLLQWSDDRHYQQKQSFVPPADVVEWGHELRTHPRGLLISADAKILLVEMVTRV